MRWDEIEGEWWTLPSERTKNEAAHRVWLSPPARAILAELGNNSEFAFPSPKVPGAPIGSINQAWERIRVRAGLEGVMRHDLRRTVATRLGALKVQRLHISLVLNHTLPGVTSRYDLYSYDPEKRRALQKWSHELMRIVGEGEQETVVEFRR